MAREEVGLLSIGDIASATGLSVDVIRVWERRYGFPVPVRLPSGHRRYHGEDLQRLRLIAEALAQGRRPAVVARADAVSLRRMVMPSGSHDLEALWHAVEDMDSERIRTLLQGSLERLGWRPFLVQVVRPLLDRVGLAWADGEIGLHHEHLVSEVLEDALRRVRLAFPVLAGRGRVLLCTLPGERHRLEMLMAALAYAAQGARTELMGLDLPIASIAQAARLLRADTVAVLLSLQNSGEPVRRLVLDLRDRLPAESRLVIGGKGATRTRQVQGVGRVEDLEVV